MQLSIRDLNPYQPLLGLTSTYESQVREAFIAYASSISELASGSLLQNQIRTSSGEIRNYTHWNYPDRSVYGSFYEYQRNSYAAIGLLILAASIVAVSLLCAVIVSLPSGLIITLIGFPIRDGLNLRRQTHAQWEEFQIQSVLDAQEYYVQGPLQREQIDINRNHQMELTVQNRLRSWMTSKFPTQEQEADAYCESKEREMEDHHQFHLRKIQAVHEKFLEIKGQNPQKAARIVISLFSGIADYEVREFQNLAEERFDELSAQEQS